MILTMLVLAALTIVAFAVLFAPLRQRSVDAPEDVKREGLEEDYRASLAALRELDDALARGEVDAQAAQREKSRLSARAARTLAALEALPPAVPANVRSPLAGAAPGVGAVVALLAVGAFTFLSSWQLAGLSPGEAQSLRSALRIPELARQAQRTGRPEDHLAWGRAAFNASRFEEAAGAYAVVLRDNPRHAEALRRVGMVLIQGGEKVREGITFVSASAQLDPDSDEGQLFLGFALARAGQETEALKALERYQSLNPQGRDADDLIATLRVRRGEGDVGQAAYRQFGCASCHGTEGRGGVGPSLRNGQLSREAAAQVIRRGAAGMRAYPEQELPDAQLQAILDLLGQWQAERR